MNQDCTLIIPTHNRSNYLPKLIKYYSRSALNVVIVDSSNNAFNYSKIKNIDYFHCPKIDFVSKIYNASNKVNSKYTILCPDDDYLLYNNVSALLSELQNNHLKCVLGSSYYFFKNEYGKYFYSDNDETLDNKIYFKNSNMRFLSNYRLCLWSLYETDFLISVFKFLKKQQLFNDNLIELIIAFLAQEFGGISYSKMPLFLREINLKNSWGKKTKPLYFVKKKKLELELKYLSNNIATEFDLHNFEYDVNNYLIDKNPNYSYLRRFLHLFKPVYLSKALFKIRHNKLPWTNLEYV